MQVTVRRPIACAPHLLRREAERTAVGEIVRELVGEGARIVHEPSGRPRLAGAPPGLHISISHCADEVAVSISDTPHGIDLETMREALRRTAHKWLTPQEMERWGRDDTSLLRAWTAKEAIWKALEVQPPGLIDVPLPHPAYALQWTPSHGGTRMLCTATAITIDPAEQTIRQQDIT